MRSDIWAFGACSTMLTGTRALVPLTDRAAAQRRVARRARIALAAAVAGVW
jgi:hypothetical protein